ncbi:hypothetical protein Fcan01_22913 [Folsomia candida]|uniref:Uncharacterized protein n=1 Tax=Folsomia candida TaxID=158441 RepID=A0A226DAE9_FOLCA|nr:hypothetical protein Fcan01_22913 [Folsomia candida]
MWTTSFQLFLLHHLRVCVFLKCTLCRWDAASEQIIPAKATLEEILYQKTQLVSGVGYAIGIILKLSVGKDSIAEKCQGVLFLLCLVICILSRWYWPRKGQLSEPCRMLNSCFKYEKVVVKEHGKPAHQPATRDKVMVAFLRLLEMTAFLFPLLVVAIQLHNPCALPFLGSWSPYCVDGDWIPPPLLVHALMLLADFWVWLHFVYDGSFYFVYAYMTSMVAMLDYLEHFEKLIREPRIYPRPKKVPSGPLECRVTRALRTYRCIRLIEKIMNYSMKGQLVPAMIGIVPLIQVFTQFVCIKLYSEIPLPGFLIFPMLLLDSAIVNLVIETMAANVHTNSVRLLAELNFELKSLPRRSKFRKELEACTATRIQFGQNFVDKGTPLVIENYCISQTVSLLLLNSTKTVGK